MMGTRVEGILTAIATAINASTGKPQGLVVSTSRRRPAAAAKFIAVFPLEDAPVRDGAQHNRIFQGTRRLLTVGILCRTAGSDLDNETLRAWVVSQLWNDITLGGKAAGLSEGETIWESEIDSQSDFSEALMHIIVEYSRPVNGL